MSKNEVNSSFVDLQAYAGLSKEQRAEKVRRMLEQIRVAVVDMEQADLRPHEREYLND